MSEQTVYQSAAQSAKTQWAKKIKNWFEKNSRYTEIAAAFGGGVISYNLLFGLRTDNRPITEDTIEFTPHDQEVTHSLNETGMHEFTSMVSDHCRVATSIDDSMSFGEAFAAARAEVGAGNLFYWNGRLYNTFTESEYLSLSEAEQTAFVENVLDAKTEFDAQTIVAESETYTTTENAHVYTEQSNIDTLEPMLAAQIEPIDADGDGEADDGAFINTDNDSQAEIVLDMTNRMAFADTTDDGFLDTAYTIDQNNDLIDPIPLSEGFPAPEMTVEQYMDLRGSDGVMDSKVIDSNGDGKGEMLLEDLDEDGVFDFAHVDTTGDNRLDTTFEIVDGKLVNGVTLPEPFYSPIVGTLGDPLATNQIAVPETVSVENGGSIYDPNLPVEGMDEHADTEMD